MARSPTEGIDPSTLPPEVREYMMKRFREGIEEHVPQNKALGMKLISMEGHRLTVRLPYDARLVGNPETGVLHGGAITTLMDSTAGSAVFLRLMQPIPVATLDLRIDYLKPATPPKDVLARAECFKSTEHVAFVRCECFHEDDESDLIAVANGTFILFRGKHYSTRKKAEP